MTPTPCETCEHLHPATMNQHPGRWLCMKFPRLEGLSAVAPKTWVKLEPYMKCTGINGGFCCLWEKRREGKKDD